MENEQIKTKTEDERAENGIIPRPVWRLPLIIFVVGFVLLIFMAANMKTCSKCGRHFLGKGYYSTDALWNSNNDDTLCKSCAQDEWSPLFDYRTKVKD